MVKLNQERILKVILGPYVSEKSTLISKHIPQVVFHVQCNANKLEIKKAVESLFEVKVSNICVLNVKGKKKRNRFGIGKRVDVRKAYVSLQKGYSVDFSGK